MTRRNVRIVLAGALFIALRAGGAAVADPLTLQIDPASGLTLLKNETAQTLDLTSYRLTSTEGALNVAGWNPISNGNELPAQFPPDNGIDDGIDWEVAVNPTSSELVEWYVTGASPFHAGQQLNLGIAVNANGTPAVEFTYTLADETLITGIVRYETIPLPPLSGDYNNDSVVDAADYVVWRKTNVGGQQGYSDWRTNFGRTAATGRTAQVVAAAVPEPSQVVLAILAALVWHALNGRGHS
jgi:hypothetical protein